MNNGYIFFRELFYVLLAALVIFAGMEFVWPNIVQAYIPLNAVLILWLIVGMVVVSLKGKQ